jgi:uncharacterized membrane protein
MNCNRLEQPWDGECSVSPGTIDKTEEKVRKADEEVLHTVPAAISVATGGAVIGAVFFGMPGAVVGGIAGALLGATARRRNGAS